MFGEHTPFIAWSYGITLLVLAALWFLSARERRQRNKTLALLEPASAQKAKKK